MKKVLLLFITLSMTIFMLTGCKKKADSEAMDTQNPGVTTTVAPTAMPTAKPTALPTVAPTVAPTTAVDNGALYIDGIYEAQAPADNEGYYVTAKVTVEGGKITAAEWQIYDEANDAPFDEEYYKVFEKLGAQPVYVQQAKDDWAGSRGYADALIETQDVFEVDAVTGATWACKQFKTAILIALKNANVK